MADRTLAHNEKGIFDDLRKDAIDPSDIEDSQQIQDLGYQSF